MHFKGNSNDLLLNPEVFNQHYIPPELPHRKPHLDKIYACISPSLKRNKPINVLLYGPSGTGKTTIVKYLLKECEDKFPLKSIYVNCWKNNSCYSVLDEIVKQLRIFRAERIDTTFKFERLEQFIKGDKFLLIVLDEVDKLTPREMNLLLYNLSSLEKVGLILIGSNKNLLSDLDRRVKSRLNTKLIEFKYYLPTEIKTILKQRADMSINPISYNDDILMYIAKLSSGDARKAIQILRNTVYSAEKVNSIHIKKKHVKLFFEKNNDFQESYLFDKLTYHHKLIFRILKKEKEVISRDLWNLYLYECKKENIEPIAKRTFSLYLKRLIELKIIGARRAKVKGNVKLYKIANRK